MGGAARLCSMEEEHVTGISKALHSALAPATGFSAMLSRHETVFPSVEAGGQSNIFFACTEMQIKIRSGI